MRIAITDACIFIDLYSLDIIPQFFNLEIEVHTSQDVLNELFSHQKEILIAYQAVSKLTVHIITEEDRKVIYQTKYPKSLSDNDKTVIHLAIKLDAMLISSDKAVRNYAKSLAIEYHGMLWILDRLVEKKLLSKKEASQKLKKLVSTNFVYQNNIEINHEMQKRLKLWEHSK